jgi:hypothetical protein
MRGMFSKNKGIEKIFLKSAIDVEIAFLPAFI